MAWAAAIRYESSLSEARRRTIFTVAVSILGLALSWTGFRMLQIWSRNANQRKFEQESGRIASEMETSFNLSLEHLRSIPAYFAASDEVSREGFREFVTPTLKRNTFLYVSAFLPRILPSELADLESVARSDGLHDFKVHSVDVDGQYLPLKQRDRYYPIYFVEPLIPELSKVLGVDVGSHPEQAKYYKAACSSNDPVVTPPLSLIEDPEDVLSIMAILSLSKSQLKGFRNEAESPPADEDSECDGVAVVILKVRPLVEFSLGSKRLGEFEVVLRDPDAEESRQLVYKNFPGDAKTIDRQGWPKTDREISFGDQSWTLTLSPAHGSTYAPAAPPYWILAVGGLLSALAAYSLSATLTIGGLRKQVDHALQLGQYRLGAKLGEGGMGAVYEASHKMLARPAAIKLIRTDNAVASKRWQSRFEREAQATAGLQSPHTVSVYDFGKTHDGTFYYVMERLNGVDLATLVEREGPLPPSRVVHLLRQACHSLAEAHATGLIHRDIKPANIFVCKQALDSDFVKILDFGLVKASRREPSVEITQAGTLLGTPAYMAPEMIQDQAVDARSDIYSLGCVAYFMLTGKTVFDGSLSAVIAGHVKKDPPKMVADNGSDIPSELERVVFRCLAKSRYHRPATAIKLEQQLAALPLTEWKLFATSSAQVDIRPNETSDSRLSKTTSMEAGCGRKPTM